MSATEIAPLRKDRIHQQKVLFKLYNNIINKENGIEFMRKG